MQSGHGSTPFPGGGAGRIGFFRCLPLCPRSLPLPGAHSGQRSGGGAGTLFAPVVTSGQRACGGGGGGGPAAACDVGAESLEPVGMVVSLMIFGGGEPESSSDDDESSWGGWGGGMVGAAVPPSVRAAFTSRPVLR